MEKENKKEFAETKPLHEYYQRKHGGGYIGAFILIFAGLLFLLNNLGILPEDAWNLLWKFWPIIIIFIGLRLLLGRSTFARNIMLLLALFLFAGILAYIFINNSLLVLPPAR